jgi:UDP-GlcNAc:undecaprenyl-phosphate/decaprenyl-phosphate GlcNAc-1-phosphate transferase
MREYLFILIIAAAVTYLLTPLVRRGAVAINAQHAPRARDVHMKPTPLLGGLAMYGGLVAGLLVADRLSYLGQAFASGRTIPGLLLAGGILVIVGIVDDRWGLGAISKLAAQILAGGIIVWSGVYLSWIPGAGGQTVTVSLEPDLSYTVTILIIVATINAVNFIDGLDGLASGIVGISAIAYMVYSYVLTNSVGVQSQSVPAVASAVLAGMCVGFLPHNFNPARIFMGDTGAMLLGLLLAYGPLASTASLDPAILVHYTGAQPLNRFPTILPLLIPIGMWLIPYTDMVLAVVRRTAKGMSPFAADRQHLHHRLLNLGHSVRSAVLLMYLWAALFSGLVVGLSVVRINLIWFALLTVGAFAALLLVTARKLRPWRNGAVGKQALATGPRPRSDDPASATADLVAPVYGADAGALPPLPAHLAAPVGPPVPGMPPPTPPAGVPLPYYGTPAPPNGAPPNGAPPNGASPNRAPRNGAPRHSSGTNGTPTPRNGTPPPRTRATGPRHRAP